MSARAGQGLVQAGLPPHASGCLLGRPIMGTFNFSADITSHVRLWCGKGDFRSHTRYGSLGAFRQAFLAGELSWRKLVWAGLRILQLLLVRDNSDIRRLLCFDRLELTALRISTRSPTDCT